MDQHDIINAQSTNNNKKHTLCIKLNDIWNIIEHLRLKNIFTTLLWKHKKPKRHELSLSHIQITKIYPYLTSEEHNYWLKQAHKITSLKKLKSRIN